MALELLISCFEDEITSAEEETFVLFSKHHPCSNLGFVDPKATTVEVSVGDRDFTIHQSPTVLNSSREGGTTGAVLWKTTPLFATWLSAPSNPLFSSGILKRSSSVLELGCGISALNALCLRGLVAHYILSDQVYVSRLVARNLGENTPNRTSAQRSSKNGCSRPSKSSPPSAATEIRFVPLDWELDDPASAIKAISWAHAPAADGADVVIACDCIYNDALITPLVDACAEVCQIRDKRDTGGGTVCVVAQPLRDADIFRDWLDTFVDRFRAWRVPDSRLPDGLRSTDGFVVHVGVLRAAWCW